MFWLNKTKVFDRGEVDEVFFKKMIGILNLNTISTWTIHKTNKYINFYDNENFYKFRFYIFRKWLKKHEIYNFEFIESLERIIYALKLEKEFNSLENSYINYFKNVIFAKVRNLKRLIVDFQELENENIYFKYDLNLFIQQNLKHDNNNDFQGEIFISNQRLILCSGIKYLSIYYKEIKEIKLKNFYIVIKTNYDDEYQIFSFDFHYIYTSIERICRMLNLRI